jgi:1-acyl-sn-glycerol-3-phosphate acyltransferase
MNAIRSALFLVLAILVTAPAGLFVAIGFILPMGVRFGIVAVWRAVFMALVRQVLGIRYRVVGRENIPDSPSIIVCKHQSAWETVALQDVFAPHWLVFVLKQELLRLPFLGWGLAAMRNISIDRAAGKNALVQVAEQGKDRLANGFWVVVFPEGTRVPPGQKRRYKPGGAHLAVQSGARVVPVAHNAGELWGRNAFIKRPGLVTVSVGPAIDPAGLTVEAVNARAEAWIEAEMQRISPHRYPNGQPAAAAA